MCMLYLVQAGLGLGFPEPWEVAFGKQIPRCRFGSEFTTGRRPEIGSLGGREAWTGEEDMGCRIAAYVLHSTMMSRGRQPNWVELACQCSCQCTHPRSSSIRATRTVGAQGAIVVCAEVNSLAAERAAVVDEGLVFLDIHGDRG